METTVAAVVVDLAGVTDKVVYGSGPDLINAAAVRRVKEIGGTTCVGKTDRDGAEFRMVAIDTCRMH